MNATPHPRAFRDPAGSRFSSMPRGAHPFPDEEPHGRAVEMADAMLDILARGGGGASTADLMQLGFTAPEIIEHHPAAKKLADERVLRQVSPVPDQVADIVAKAAAPMASRPPLPRDTGETQALSVRWQNYCAAHTALILDPWPGQRERCISLLTLVLDRTALFAHNRAAVLHQVGVALAKVGS